MHITPIEIALPDVEEPGKCGYIELDSDGYLVLPNTKVGNLALSFWVKSDSNTRIYADDKSVPVTSKWSQVSFLLVSDGTDVVIKLLPGNYYIYKVKMKVGSKITPWSMSPDDDIKQNNEIFVRLNKAEQLISPEAIVSTVKNSEMYQDDINGIRGRLDVAEQKITKDAIVSTVKSGIDGEYLASEINQSASDVTIQASHVDGIVGKLNSELKISGNSIELTTGHFTINSKNMTLDAQGNATFSGDISGSTITGANGSFSKGFDVNVPTPTGEYTNLQQRFTVANEGSTRIYSENIDADPEGNVLSLLQVSPSGVYIYAKHGTNNGDIELCANGTMNFLASAAGGFNFKGGPLRLNGVTLLTPVIERFWLSFNIDGIALHTFKKDVHVISCSCINRQFGCTYGRPDGDYKKWNFEQKRFSNTSCEVEVIYLI